MTEAQAEAVVRMQLGQLARLQRDEIIKEHGELRQKIRGWEELISSERNMLAVIKKDLLELRDRYGEGRRTEITGEAARVTDLDLIPEEDQAITISHRGYIKRLPLNTYRAQGRGGKGVKGGETRDEDFIEHFFVASTHAYLLCFTNRGQLYWLRVHEVPEGSRTSAGRAMANVLSLKEGEGITSVIPVRDLEAARASSEPVFLMMATRRGIVKKTALSAYARPKSGGIIGISLGEGDQLIGVVQTRPEDEIVLCTRNGMAIRFPDSGKGGVRPMGRDTRGVRGIHLRDGDEVVGMVVADPEGYLLTVCANGYGKRTPFGPNTAGDVADHEEPEEVEEARSASEEQLARSASEGSDDDGGAGQRSNMSYRKQNRGGYGIRDIRATERNGPVVGVSAVRDNDDVMLVTTGGMVIRMRADSIRLVGRNTQGVRLMDPREGDKIAALARVPAGAEEPEEARSASEGPLARSASEEQLARSASEEGPEAAPPAAGDGQP
jgi:DNA gyrase subunit A